MDPTRRITYRDFVLNDETISDNIVGGGGVGSGITGCVVDSFDLSDVDVVQWKEKRSQGDGSDAGDVFLGDRRIRVAGTLYGLTRNLFFDKLNELRAALNPVLAQREEPLDKGYRPLYFSVPTNRAADYPSGAIDLQVKALPRTIQHMTLRDALGGDDRQGLAIPWQATFICKDPGIYGADPVEVSVPAVASASGTSIGTNNFFHDVGHGLVAGDRVTFSAAAGGGTGLTLGTTYYVISTGLGADDFKVSTTSEGTELDITVAYTTFSYVKSSTVSGTWNNRGNYLAKFNAIFAVGAGAGRIDATVGDSVFTITVPASTVTRTIRVKADDRVITFEESGGDEETQMSRITFTGDTTWPLIDPGDTPYSITFHGMGSIEADGRFWMYEQYA